MRLEPSPAEVTARVTQELFGRTLVMNVHRGMVAEGIVAMALEPEWKWCSRDYNHCDLVRGDGKRLEVKQSAARQSWSPLGAKPSRASFDIAKRRHADEPGVSRRQADVYVFAWHGGLGDDADHRDAGQWRFYVVETARLPPGLSIGLRAVELLSRSCGFGELAQRVEEVVGPRVI